MFDHCEDGAGSATPRAKRVTLVSFQIADVRREVSDRTQASDIDHEDQRAKAARELPR
jgi:hypothetical protein